MVVEVCVRVRLYESSVAWSVGVWWLPLSRRLSGSRVRACVSAHVLASDNFFVVRACQDRSRERCLYFPQFLLLGRWLNHAFHFRVIKFVRAVDP